MRKPIVVGISMVRNAVDLVRVNILHHLSLGLERIVVVDNGSTDGTERVLAEMSKDPRVRCSREETPFLQGPLFTRLAREAYHEGADWVLPIDADEFWWTRNGDFLGELANTESVLIHVQLVNFAQRRTQLESTPDALLNMTWRVAEPVGTPQEASELVGSGKIAHIEARYPAKWIIRPTSTVQISHGNHHISGLVGGIEESDRIVCLHAPLRSRASLYSKAAHGRRVEEAGDRPNESWHVRRFRRLEDEGLMEQEWAANSYQDGALDVFGTPHPLLFDPTLREVVKPHLRRSPLRLLTSISERVMQSAHRRANRL